MATLTEIANKYTCDKGTEHYEKHGYTEEYQKIIPSSGEVNLLEIGVWHGDSLKMWREYNPEMKIDAIDIDMDVFKYVKSEGNLKIHIGDQSDWKFLRDVVDGKTYDFIIDDGSHVGQHITASFKMLWQHLKSGGYYFIEDLHAGHANRQETIKVITEFLAGQSYFMTLLLDAKLLIIEKR
jgi:cephalosporin hydroxylase